MKDEEYLKMAHHEMNHWWYRALHQRVFSTLIASGIKHDAQIVDAGCGTGGLLMKLSQQGYAHIQGFDASAIAVKICTNRGLDVQQNRMQNLHMLLASASCDAVLSLDNLYFLTDHEQQLYFKSVYEVLKPGGILVLNVPSYFIFRGNHDNQVGIKERFTKRSLFKHIPFNNYSVVQTRCWPFILSPVIAFIRWYQRIQHASSVASDLKPVHPWLNRVFFMLTQLELLLPGKLTFGSSIYLVLKKNENE